MSYRQALAINANDPSLWLKLGKAVMERAETTSNSSEGYDFAVTGTYAALVLIGGLLSIPRRRRRVHWRWWLLRVTGGRLSPRIA